MLGPPQPVIFTTQMEPPDDTTDSAFPHPLGTEINTSSTLKESVTVTGVFSVKPERDTYKLPPSGQEPTVQDTLASALIVPDGYAPTTPITSDRHIKRTNKADFLDLLLTAYPPSLITTQYCLSFQKYLPIIHIIAETPSLFNSDGVSMFLFLECQ